MGARRLIPLLVAGVTAALLVAGCGNGNDSGSTGSNGGGAPAATASAAGTKVTSAEKEYSITLSTMDFKAGTYTFEVQNQGTMPHDLAIQGPGLSQQTSPMVQPGQTAQLTVTLQPGTYELWCTVPGHKELGMDLKIQVT